MRTIKRHEISDIEDIQIELDENLDLLSTYIESIQSSPGEMLGKAISPRFEAFILAVAAEVERSKIIQHLDIFKSVILSNFRFGAGDEPFSANFDDTTINFTPQPKTDFMSVDYWQLAYHACMIARDKEGMRFLSTIDELVFVNSNNGARPFDLAYYRFLAHFFSGGKNTGALLIAAMEEAQKPQPNATRTKFVEEVRYPELRLLQDYVMNDPEAFNEHLYEALVDHKKYYGTKDNAFATPGWISLPLLSVCVLAHDTKKFPIEVESEYIPRWLILGEGITS